MSTTAFGDFLRFYRSRVPLTQEELAERTGLSTRAISDMERGRTLSPQFRTVQLLVDGLGLFGEETAEFTALARASRVVAAQERPETPFAATSYSLPPVLIELTGRESEKALLDVFAADAASSSRLQIAVVHGAPGAGKTALAVDAGHRLGARFADGCVFLDLRGTDTEPLTPDKAAHRLLRSFGVDERQIPGDPDDKLSLYRSQLRDRTVLLVLDNAENEAQVRPLLASSPGTLVLLTSRRTMTGLDARHRLPLELLPLNRSVELLRAVTGPERLDAEPEAAERVAELCGGLPLALLIAGNRLTSRPQWTIGHLAEQLEDERRRLSVLRAGDLQVRAAFEISYHQLSAGAATLFRRLALVTSPEVSAALAAVLVDDAEEALEELADASLLGISETPGRYTRHDLLHVFAAERLELDDDPATVLQTRTRLRHWILDVATRAALFFDHDVPARRAGPVHDKESASRWLDLELENWRGALRSAATEGEHDRVLALAQAMHWYSDMHGVGELWREIFAAGAHAARQLGNAKDAAEQLNYLSWALYALCGQPHEALTVHEEAATLPIDDTLTEAWNCYYGSAIRRRVGEPEKAVSLSRRSVALFQRAGYQIGENLALSLLGLMLHTSGNLAEAAEVQQRSVDQHRKADGDDELLSMLLIRLATTLADAGQVIASMDLLDEAESLFRRHSNTAGTARVQHNRGVVLMDAGRFGEAREQLLAALSEARLSDHRVEILARLAELADTAGDSAQAREYRVRALAECDRYDTPAVRVTATKLVAALR
ncbi:helix-turn-helix domain-containing protein [Lentzea sp. NBC_00516]|uniref:ATP-binding protein n=1 Tax=Lentzea sp. NBC_00516 TaxID=2903582 RepID=UPI002E819976|nr:helix-turn-helix domain-containing protein [Lentzea sp. NBC_00516]WUD28454.1 helix-turn-helix domain-containing protein [Lentzea sp. NBC_00516]